MDPSANDAIGTGGNLANTVIAVVKEVGEMLNDVPYVKSLLGVVLQIIKIRDEIKANEARCQELINKVLRFSKMIVDTLAYVGRSKDKHKLSRLEGHLGDCQRTLSDVCTTLEQHTSRGRFMKLISRGLDDLNALDRRIDELNSTFMMNSLVDIQIMQVASVPDAGESSIPNNVPDHIIIPSKPQLMVERQAEVDTALEILLSAEPSRVVILGGGGFGKTTLARTILHDPKIAERYKSRYFLSCQGITDSDNLLFGFAGLLGINVAPSAVVASARRMLESSTTLLCFDNFETPWEPFNTRGKIEEILETIADIPNLSLMVTLRGEQRPSKVAWSTPLLPPLSTLSLDGAKSILQTIAGNHAVDNYSLQLLKSVDGIPLAITLVSTLLRDGESSESLWRRWSTNHTQVVHTGGDDRQSNLDRSISLSISSPRMNKDADGCRMLLAILSLLPDGLPAYGDSLESWQKHLNSNDHVIIRVLQAIITRVDYKRSKITDIHDVVQTLRSVALIKVDESGTAPRIRMLSPIRLFCQQFFSKEIALLLRKTVDYYVQMLDGAKSDVTNSQHYSQITSEIKNIHSVFQKAFAASNSLNLDRLSLLKLIEVTNYLAAWSSYTGYYAKETIQMALLKANSFILDPLAFFFGAHCLITLGRLYEQEDDLKQAENCFREAVKLFKGAYNSKGKAVALGALGIVLFDMGQGDQAESAFRESLKIYTRVRNKQGKEGQAEMYYWLSQVYLKKDQYSEAQASLVTALEGFKLIPTLIGQAKTTASMSVVHVKLGNFIEAEKSVNESLATAKQANYATGEGYALWQLGQINLFTDRLTDAERTLEKSMAIYRNQNILYNELNAANDLACVYIQSDRFSSAEALLTMAYDKANRDSVGISRILTTLGWLYICGDRLDKAEHSLCDALQLFHKFDDKFFQARILALLGSTYLKLGRLDGAERVLNSVLDLGTWREIEMCRLWVLGDFYVVKGQLDDAETSLNSAMFWANKCYSSYQKGNIFRSIGTLNSKRGRIDLAIENFLKALEFHRKAHWVSEQATDIKLIGEAYRMLGRLEEADVKFKEAESLMDTVREVRTLL